MPLKPLRPREIVRRLEKSGFKLTRQKGSHARYVKGPHGVTVPIHPGEVPLAVIRSILKQAGLTSKEWEKL